MGASQEWRAGVRRLSVCLALALLTAFVYARTAENGFIAFDDPEYVSENPVVRQGLAREGVVWALRATEQGNWHPLTWWSHMLDVSLFGLNPGPHHLVSAALHGASALLLFVALEGMTGAAWPSALAAALFAAHPLRVESVAWAAERKDVLCGLFWMLGLLAHLRYARRPCAPRYLAVAACLALALLAKPAAVTLPLALLLLDWWPLGRLRTPASQAAGGPSAPTTRGAGRLVVEKLPLLGIALAVALTTLALQVKVGSVKGVASHPVELRLENALVSTAVYPLQTLWPQGLGVLYPFPAAGIPWWRWSAAALFVAALSLAAVALRRRAPWLAVGWVWYLVTLAPVSGLIQAGEQARADRYTYLPSIGLSLLLAWALAAAAQRSPRLRGPVVAAAVAAPIVLAAVAREQAGRWRDSETLFRHTLAVAGESGLVHANLGSALNKLGRWEEALREHEAALSFDPADAVARYNAGIALVRLRRWEEAAAAFGAVVAASPGDRDARYNLGVALSNLLRWREALDEYRAIVARDPGDHQARYAAGVSAVQLGDRAGAEEQRRALESLNPQEAAGLARLMAQRGW